MCRTEQDRLTEIRTMRILIYSPLATRDKYKHKRVRAEHAGKVKIFTPAEIQTYIILCSKNKQSVKGDKE